jgi:hypothetical protein
VEVMWSDIKCIVDDHGGDNERNGGGGFFKPSGVFTVVLYDQTD